MSSCHYPDIMDLVTLIIIMLQNTYKQRTYLKQGFNPGDLNNHIMDINIISQSGWWCYLLDARARQDSIVLMAACAAQLLHGPWSITPLTLPAINA